MFSADLKQPSDGDSPESSSSPRTRCSLAARKGAETPAKQKTTFARVTPDERASTSLRKNLDRLRELRMEGQHEGSRHGHGHGHAAHNTEGVNTPRQNYKFASLLLDVSKAQKERFIERLNSLEQMSAGSDASREKDVPLFSRIWGGEKLKRLAARSKWKPTPWSLRTRHIPRMDSFVSKALNPVLYVLLWYAALSGSQYLSEPEESFVSQTTFWPLLALAYLTSAVLAIDMQLSHVKHMWIDFAKTTAKVCGRKVVFAFSVHEKVSFSLLVCFVSRDTAIGLNSASSSSMSIEYWRAKDNECFKRYSERIWPTKHLK